MNFNMPQSSKKQFPYLFCKCVHIINLMESMKVERMAVELKWSCKGSVTGPSSLGVTASK